MRILFYIVILLTTVPMLTNAQDTLYFDQEWQLTTKGNHSYFRPLPLPKLGELELLRDYYKNGNLQMQGYTESGTDDQYVGDVYWYDENGLDASIRQYYNKSPQKELIYYQPDGSIWQKISYNQLGKKKQVDVYWKDKLLLTGTIDEQFKLTGNFPSDFYLGYELRDYTAAANSVAIEEVLVETTGINPLTDEEGNSAVTPAFSIITLWQNGQKAKEVTYGYTTYGDPEKLTQKSWDLKGNLLTDMDFIKFNYDSPKMYIDTDYFRSNGMAVGIRSEIPVYNNNRDGVSMYFDLHGQKTAEEKHQDGELYETISYESGVAKIVSRYRDGAPFDGQFSELNHPIELVYQMRAGQREDRSYVRNIVSGAIIAEGEYKNGAPYNGTFYNTMEDLTSRFLFKEGKQEGVQTLLNSYNLDEIVEQFEMRTGLRQGYRKIYSDGTIQYESTYVQDRIESGTIPENGGVSVYENGKLIERKKFLSAYEHQTASIEKFEDGQPTVVSYANFTITDDPQDVYEGFYRVGKPYEGYFLGDTVIDDIRVVDYYDKGEKKRQYSFEFLEQLDNYRHYTYNLVTEFDTQGRVVNGPTYQSSDDGMIVCHYENYKRRQFDLNVFGMHYFNRICYIRQDDAIEIKSLDNKSALRIYRKDDYFTADIYQEGELVKTKSPIQVAETGAPNSILHYYWEDGKIQTYSVTLEDYDDVQFGEDFRFLQPIFFLFPSKKYESLEEVFDFLFAQSKEAATEETTSFAFYDYPFNEDNHLGFEQYDEMGNIALGIRSKFADHRFVLEGIYEGEVKETLHFETIDDYLGQKDEIYRRIFDRLLNP